MGKKIVGITACPVGIAHTYMAATALENIATAKGHTIKIEKQGSMGTENELTAQEIAQADVVIIAVNKNVNLDRFKGKLLYQTTADHAMKNKEEVLEKAFTDAKFHDVKGSTVAGGTIILGKTNNDIMNHIMAGLSYMIPMVIAAGLLLALANVFAFQKDELGRITQWGYDETTFKGHFFARLFDIGKVGFLLMIPLFAGFVANSISGMPAIAPAMIGAYIANDPKYLGTETGGGFIAAILVALMAGYLVHYLKMIKWPSFFKPILGIMILPLISTFVVMLVVTYGIGKPISIFMNGMYSGLDSFVAAHPNSKFLIGAILGGMIGFDFGGPVNKTALLFGAAIFTDSIATGGISGANFSPNSAIGAAISVAPLGVWLSTKIFPKHFTSDEHVSATSAFPMGLVGVSEGAIPFAINHPVQIMTSSVIGSAMAGGFAYSLGVKVYGGVGSPLGVFIGYIEGPKLLGGGFGAFPILAWFFITLSGIVTTALVLGLFKTLEAKKQAK